MKLARTRHAAAPFAATAVAAIAAFTLLLNPSAAFGQLDDGRDIGVDVEEEIVDEDEVAIAPVFGLELDPELANYDLIDPAWIDAEWQDPVDRFELADEPLAPAPSFDFWRLHASEVFETGIANLSVSNPPDLTLEIENHTRALQAVATGELALETAGEDIATARSAIAAANRAIDANIIEIEETENELSVELAQLEDIANADAEEVTTQTNAREGVDSFNDAIIELAVQVFTGENNELEAIFEDPFSAEPLKRRVVTDQVRDVQRADIALLEQAITESETRRELLAQDRTSIESANSVRLGLIESLTDANSALRDGISEDREEIESLQERRTELREIIRNAEAFTEVTAFHYQEAYHQRLTSFVSGTNIPLVALNAYVRAQNTLAAEARSCGIHWSQLAGIGGVESSHGHFGGSTLDVNGNATVKIYGLQLNGDDLSASAIGAPTEATGEPNEDNDLLQLARITDTDDGLLDGDRVFDRAVGPMQFIPTTWFLYEPDGNDDGEADPQNVYDAALASARYLCDAPGSMVTTDGEQSGYFAYNQSEEYARRVTRTGRRYHVQLDVSPESNAFAAFSLIPTPEEQEALDRAEAAAIAKAQAVAKVADEVVLAATEECQAQVDAEAATAAASPPPPDAAEPPAGEGAVANAEVAPAVEPVDCTEVGEAAREAATAAAALAYVAEPLDDEQVAAILAGGEAAELLSGEETE